MLLQRSHGLRPELLAHVPFRGESGVAKGRTPDPAEPSRKRAGEGPDDFLYDKGMFRLARCNRVHCSWRWFSLKRCQTQREQLLAVAGESGELGPDL